MGVGAFSRQSNNTAAKYIKLTFEVCIGKNLENSVTIAVLAGTSVYYVCHWCLSLNGASLCSLNKAMSSKPTIDSLRGKRGVIRCRLRL